MSDCGCEFEVESAEQARVLWVLLAVNGGMFLAEFGVGLFADSTALIADSLDNLADALVYSVSLYAVSRSAFARASAARLSGWLQLALGVFVLLEVGRRMLFGSRPEPALMIGVSILALIANVICLRLISVHREGGVHMRASFIFSQNDVIANAGVIVSGLLVAWSGAAWWDLLAGAAIGVLVLSGGVRIVKEARAASAEASA